jgi:hypothetical protein
VSGERETSEEEEQQRAKIRGCVSINPSTETSGYTLGHTARHGIETAHRLTNSCFLFNDLTNALIEKLIVAQPVKKLPAFYGSRKFTAVFKTALHWPLSRAR